MHTVKSASNEKKHIESTENMQKLPESLNGIWRYYTNGNNVNDLIVEGDVIWAGTTGGVMRWNRRDGNHIQYTIMDGIAGLNVLDIIIDGAGYKWLLTNGGINRFDGDRWESISGQEGLASNVVSDMATKGNGSAPCDDAQPLRLGLLRDGEFQRWIWLEFFTSGASGVPSVVD